MVADKSMGEEVDMSDNAKEKSIGHRKHMNRADKVTRTFKCHTLILEKPVT